MVTRNLVATDKINGANAGGRRQLPIRSCWAARVGRLFRQSRHCFMTTARKMSTRIGLSASSVGVAFLLTSCLTPVESRVPIPGSSLSAVVTADLAGCYDVQLFEHGHPLPGERQCLGPYVSQRCALAHVSTTSNVVTIVWTDGDRRYSAAVDVEARRLVDCSKAVPVR